jgi:hypothetical protein
VTALTFLIAVLCSVRQMRLTSHKTLKTSFIVCLYMSYYSCKHSQFNYQQSSTQTTVFIIIRSNFHSSTVIQPSTVHISYANNLTTGLLLEIVNSIKIITSVAYYAIDCRRLIRLKLTSTPPSEYHPQNAAFESDSTNFPSNNYAILILLLRLVLIYVYSDNMDCASWNENDVGQWLEDNDFAEHKQIFIG